MKNPFSGKAHEFIRNKILAGDFGPGYRLKTQELTKMIGVSATPIRDALRQLESEGLVEILPRLGASVKTFDLVTFKEMSELRCALECLAAELAASNRTDAELALIASCMSEMGELVRGGVHEGNREQMRAADIRFHVAILGAAHNRTLYNEVLRLQVIHRLNSPSVRGKIEPPTSDVMAWQASVYESHERIFNGIRDRNPEVARLAMKEHIQGIVDRAVLAMAKSLQGNNFSQLASVGGMGYIE